MAENEERINAVIASNLVRLLRSSNRTQLELAEFLGVTQAAISNWCNGVKMPRMDKIDLICEFFGVKRSQLMSLDAPSSSVSSGMVLDPDEQHLFDLYRGLNNLGRSRLIEYAEDIAGNAKYKKSDSAEMAV